MFIPLVIFLGLANNALSNSPDLIGPCIYKENNTINSIVPCSYSNWINLTSVFENLSNNLTKNEKHFTSLVLQSLPINQIEENAFGDITFDKIVIFNCNRLTWIPPNAFNGTDQVSKEIYIDHNRSLRSIFSILNKFENAEVISLSNNFIGEIPTKVFPNLSRLRELHLSSILYTVVGDYAFSKLNNLEYLDLSGTSFLEIPENAFAFEVKSNSRFILNLGYGYSFDRIKATKNPLTRIGRPTMLGLNGIKNLDEEILSPFLKSNPENSLVIDGADCKSCGNYWLYKNQSVINKSSKNTCAYWTGEKFNDTWNFGNCTPLGKIIQPCNLNKGPSITCYYGNDTIYESIFERMSKELSDKDKHFESITFETSIIHILQDNFFKDITFDEITIKQCNDLHRIEQDAFNGTNRITRSISFMDNSELGSSTNNNSLFKALSKFNNIESIRFYQNNITEIPSRTFSKLTKIENLEFIYPMLTLINENAFSFDIESNKTLNLELGVTNTTKFDDKSLSDIRRPCKLVLRYPESLEISHNDQSIIILPEAVFFTFIMENTNNLIKIQLGRINCKDCRNYWLKKNYDMVKNRIDGKCSDNTEINNTWNFFMCT